VQEGLLSRASKTEAPRPQLVLFDLDGTLADTAADLANAVNLCRASRGFRLLPLEDLRPWTSHGARGLIRHAFGMEPGDAGYELLRAEFLDNYERALCVHTKLYDGMDQTLAGIEASGRRWGVVTNKLARFTDPLIQALGLSRRASCVVSGDTASKPKPDPAPITHALEACGATAGQSVYVGDDLRDIQAGRAAGVRTIVAAYGYLAGATDFEPWGPDFVIDRPLDLLDWLDRQAATP
jgi:N-acetyl-D-muramate 6-phosphate phosphatase